jgi:hypothetical protein
MSSYQLSVISLDALHTAGYSLGCAAKKLCAVLFAKAPHITTKPIPNF